MGLACKFSSAEEAAHAATTTPDGFWAT